MSNGLRYKYPQKARLKKFSEYKNALKNRAAIGKYLVLHLDKVESAIPRLGMVVSRRFGKAVARNRFKRLIREVFRTSDPQLLSHLQIIIKPRRYALSATKDDIAKDFYDLLAK